MARSFIQITARTILALATLAAGSLALGCTSEVVGGSEGEGGAGGGECGGEGGEGGAGGEACMVGESRQCGNPIPDPSGMGEMYGSQTCTPDENGNPVWSDCLPPNTPLVLSFDRAPVQLLADTGEASFDFTGMMSVATDWPAASTPWLALDRNGNGAIDDAGELFGSATELASGGRAANGFVALRELDSNGDGQITPADAGWSKLLLWSDGDLDRVSKAGELSAVSSRKLLSIELGYTSAPRCDARGNCEVERATFRYVDEAGLERTGDIVDVHLKVQ